MDAKQVAGNIYKHFWNYEYKLFNSYLFAWESDFFAISKSGYAIEVEIKVSRSDFKADFKKEKHGIFKSICAKKEIHVYRKDISYNSYGDILLKGFSEPELQMDRKTIDTTKELIERNYHFGNVPKHMQKKYVVNDWDFANIRIYKDPYGIDVRAPVSNVGYIKLNEYHSPHQFYYAVPVGLLQLDEIPSYAGLIYVRDGACEVARKAPYMHKRPMDLRSQLLSKFYHLWLNRTTPQQKLELFTNNEAA